MSRSRRGVLAATFGFAGATAVPVAWSHLGQLPLWREVPDVVASILLFAVAFLAGGWLVGRAAPAVAIRRRSSALLGAGAAGLLWTVLFIFWTVLPASTAELFEPIALAAHLVLAVAAGGAVRELENVLAPLRART